MKTISGFIFLLTVTCSFSDYPKLAFPVTVACGADSLSNGILIINAFDAMSLHVRKGKKELFNELADSLKQYLYEGIRYQNMGEPAIFSERLDKTASSGDATIFSIMDKKGALIAIVIRNLDIFFEQTGVEVTKEVDGKKRVVCSVITYDTYRNAIKLKSSETKICEFFTKRSVVSGFFAAGPDVVGKSKYAFSIVNRNAISFLLHDFPGN